MFEYVQTFSNFSRTSKKNFWVCETNALVANFNSISMASISVAGKL